MTRQFKLTAFASVVWLVNGFVTVGCFVAFLAKDGKEVALAYYIPLDCALSIAKACFYFYRYYYEKQYKED